MSFSYGAFEFSTRLQAQWAAFFDLAGWTWRSNVVPIYDWKPDFFVSFPCRHSECSGSHELMVSVLPVEKLDGLRSHPALSHTYGVNDERGRCVADAGALFGANPAVTTWEMSHGAGGGIDSVDGWVPGAMDLWRLAAGKVEAQ